MEITFNLEWERLESGRLRARICGEIGTAFVAIQCVDDFNRGELKFQWKDLAFYVEIYAVTGSSGPESDSVYIHIETPVLPGLQVPQVKIVGSREPGDESIPWKVIGKVLSWSGVRHHPGI